MTSRGPLVKKGIFRFFPFHTGNSVSNKIFRDSVRDSAIAEIDWHYRYVGGISFWWGEGQKICQVITEI